VINQIRCSRESHDDDCLEIFGCQESRRRAGDADRARPRSGCARPRRIVSVNFDYQFRIADCVASGAERFSGDSSACCTNC
jgi:hypothetical protein